MQLRLALSVMLAVLLLAAACAKPKVGDKCSDGKKGFCKNKNTAIVCVDGEFIAVGCGGANGCSAGVPFGAGEVSCKAGGDVGDGCTGDPEYACSDDNKKMLVCKKHTWQLKMACHSPKGCVASAQGVSCENAEAEVGDACDKEDTFACSPDKKTILACNGKKYILASTCRGENHCRIKGNKLDCDTSVAEVGDACDEDGKLACDPAKKTMLKCDGKKFAKEQECKKRCNNALNKYECEQG